MGNYRLGGESGDPAPHFRKAALLFLVVVCWRLGARPLREWWRDWTLVVAVEGILLTLLPRSANRVLISVVVMAYLMGVYLVGQWPHVLAAWR